MAMCAALALHALAVMTAVAVMLCSVQAHAMVVCYDVLQNTSQIFACKMTYYQLQDAKL